MSDIFHRALWHMVLFLDFSSVSNNSMPHVFRFAISVVLHLPVLYIDVTCLNKHSNEQVHVVFMPLSTYGIVPKAICLSFHVCVCLTMQRLLFFGKKPYICTKFSGTKRNDMLMN